MTAAIHFSISRSMSIEHAPRYNEWGRAVLELQKNNLRTSLGHEYFFCAYYTDPDEAECRSLSSEVAGALMSVSASAHLAAEKTKNPRKGNQQKQT